LRARLFVAPAPRRRIILDLKKHGWQLATFDRTNQARENEEKLAALKKREEKQKEEAEKKRKEAELRMRQAEERRRKEEEEKKARAEEEARLRSV
jgi:hypothetical protein